MGCPARTWPRRSWRCAGLPLFTCASRVARGSSSAFVNLGPRHQCIRGSLGAPARGAWLVAGRALSRFASDSSANGVGADDLADAEGWSIRVLPILEHGIGDGHRSATLIPMPRARSRSSMRVPWSGPVGGGGNTGRRAGSGISRPRSSRRSMRSSSARPLRYICQPSGAFDAISRSPLRRFTAQR